MKTYKIEIEASLTARSNWFLHCDLREPVYYSCEHIITDKQKESISSQIRKMQKDWKIDIITISVIELGNDMDIHGKLMLSHRYFGDKSVEAIFTNERYDIDNGTDTDVMSFIKRRYAECNDMAYRLYIENRNM